jgi:hypothetical protein
MKGLEPDDEEMLACDVSDEAIEAAANTIPGPAFSIVGAPTVSILFACCGNDGGSNRLF